MRFNNQRPMGRFEDRTGWSPARHALEAVLINGNPVIAGRKIQSALIERGVLSPPKPTFTLGLPGGPK